MAASQGEYWSKQNTHHFHFDTVLSLCLVFFSKHITCVHTHATGANPRRYDKRKKTDDRDFLSLSLVYLPFLRTGSYKLKLSPTFWLLKKHNENKIIFNSNHNLSLVSDKIKVFMAATQKKKQTNTKFWKFSPCFLQNYFIIKKQV